MGGIDDEWPSDRTPPPLPGALGRLADRRPVVAALLAGATFLADVAAGLAWSG